MCPPRIIAKESLEEKKLAPAPGVMVCLPALMRSASTSASGGKGSDAEQAVLGLQPDVDALAGM